MGSTGGATPGPGGAQLFGLHGKFGGTGGGGDVGGAEGSLGGGLAHQIYPPTRFTWNLTFGGSP